MNPIYDAVRFTQQGFDQGAMRGKQERMNKLASLANQAGYGAADPYINEAMTVDAGAGRQLQQNVESDHENTVKKAAGAAQYVLNAMKSNNPAAMQGAWAAARPYFEKTSLAAGGPPPPEQFDAATMEPLLHKVLAAAGGMDAGTSVQSTYINQAGERVAIMRDGSQKVLGAAENRLQAVNTGGSVTTFDPRSGNFGGGAPNAPQQQQAQQEGDVQAISPPDGDGTVLTSMKDESGNPVRMSVDVLAGLNRAGKLQVQEMVPAVQSSVPVTLSPQEIERNRRDDEKAAQQAQRDAVRTMSSDEVKMYGLPAGTVAQIDGGGKISVISKPDANSGQNTLPVAAQRMDSEIQGKLETLSQLADVVKLHVGRIRDGKTNISPVNAAFAKGRNALGFATDNDANILQLKADLKQFVNEKLNQAKGPQTDQDAKRAFEAVLDSNDPNVILTSLKRIADWITKETGAQVRSRSLLYRNNGTSSSPAPVTGGWSISEVK